MRLNILKIEAKKLSPKIVRYPDKVVRLFVYPLTANS